MRTRYVVRLLVTSVSAFSLLGAGLVGCGGSLPIQGTTAIAVLGQLPPPPPPPIPPPPPPPEPPRAPPRVEVRDNKIEIREKIQFEYNKAIIRDVSFDLLAEIADVIKKHPHIKKLRIEGHASAEGEDNYNKLLSDRRAKAVMKHLVERGGIPGETLVAKGYGEEKPVAPNDTEENRERNRRVEFNIIEQDITQKKVEIDSTTGQEKLLEETQQRLKAPDADEPEGRAQPETPTKPAKPEVTAKSAKPATPAKHATPAKTATPAKPAKTATPAKPAKHATPTKLPAKPPAKPAAGKATKKR